MQCTNQQNGRLINLYVLKIRTVTSSTIRNERIALPNYTLSEIIRVDLWITGKTIFAEMKREILCKFDMVVSYSNEEHQEGLITAISAPIPLESPSLPRHFHGCFGSPVTQYYVNARQYSHSM